MENRIEKKRDKRTFWWMPKLDFYVFREFLIPFSVLIFAFTVLFLIGDVFNDVDKFLDEAVSKSFAVEYFALRIPGNIRFILPITVLLSCMYTLANFGRHREITAMRASGISLFRCAVPIYLVAFIVMLVNFWFNETLVASCTRKAESILREIDSLKSGSSDNKQQQEGGTLQYPSNDGKRNWVFGQFISEGTQFNVRLKFFEEQNGTKKTIRYLDAQKVDYNEKIGWTFIDCYEYRIASNGLKLPRKYHDVLVVPSTEAPETPESVLKANTPPENLSALEIYSFLRNNKNLVPRIYNYYATYFYQHLAFPWACFLCAFLALPLAAKNERSGIFIAIATAVAVIVAYQIISEVFIILGKNGSLPPILAGVFPTIAFAAYGLILAKKSG